MALIRTEGLTYSYAADRQLLQGVDFSLEGGEKVAILGPNGSGKTTFLHLLVGLKQADSGQMYVFDKLRVKEADFVDVRARVGFLFQDPDDQIFSPTVLEDVAFGPLNLGLSREKALALAKQTLADLDMKGFEDRLVHQLSGGEKRLISLAGILAMQPEVLLLDEPSNALDAKARERLLAVLKGLPHAMIIISHDQELVDSLVTRKLNLQEGRLSSTEDAEGVS